MGHYCEDCNEDVAHCVCPPLPVTKDILTTQDHAALAKAFNDMQAKMRVQAAKGYNGWHDPDLCPASRLRAMLIACVQKGDPVDVMNLAMMLHARGEPTHVENEKNPCKDEGCLFYGLNVDCTPHKGGCMAVPMDEESRQKCAAMCDAQFVPETVGTPKFKTAPRPEGDAPGPLDNDLPTGME